MRDTEHRAVAVVGVGSIFPDAPDVASFWENIKTGRYSISDVDPERWDPALYYDADPKATDKSYSKIGGWVRDWEWDPIGWRLPIPPKVSDAMDEAQRWAINCARAALNDFGYPDRPLDADRTAVILGNAMAGEKHYMSSLRVHFPEFARELSQAESFVALPADVRDAIIGETRGRFHSLVPEITEDSMPGELANCIAGRIANLFNLHGPNYVVDAACASAMAAFSASMEGLEEGDFDTVLTGGIDRNMGATSYVKFCKIGALSATGTRPYAAGADGFVMGEGAALFLLKRLEDAERDNDRIYAVLRGLGGASDGRGKGITAPNPVGQKLAIQRGWENAGLSPATGSFVEGHGTSTKVGDVVEVQSLAEVFSNAGSAPGSVALGSVKSNIGHLKGAAGAAGILKTVLALHHKVLPPSVNFDEPNPNIDFEHSPFYVNSELRDWDKPASGARRAGVSAFGFGGTNFHAVLEEHIPGRIKGNGKRNFSAAAKPQGSARVMDAVARAKAPLRGAVVIGADSPAELIGRLRRIKTEAEASRVPPTEAPLARDLAAPVRVALDFKDPATLARSSERAIKALERDEPAMWRALAAQGVFFGRGPAAKTAFLYPGQGSQYVNMLRELAAIEPIAKETLEQADRIMMPYLGKPLTEYLFADNSDEAAFASARRSLMQTEITQPAVLTVDIALTRMLDAYGIAADMVMGHSLGEYGALVAAGALRFGDSLEAVSARGREMASVSVEDNGKMAAVFAPLPEIQRVLATVDGYVVIANINSNDQGVIGGASDAIDLAIQAFASAGIDVRPLPVSHAFHTSIVAPASEPMRAALTRLQLRAPQSPIISNVTGEFYPTGSNAVETMLDLLARQIASPVQFVKGLNALYDAGARVFVEVGPKNALKGFVDNVLGERGDVVSLFTNHPKVGETGSFNQALCGLYAAGHGSGRADPLPETVEQRPGKAAPAASVSATAPSMAAPAPIGAGNYQELGRRFAEFLEHDLHVHTGGGDAISAEPVVVTGAAIGLPGSQKLFDEENIGRILHGEQFIDVIPHRFRQAMTDKHITRLVKSPGGEATFETIDKPQDVVKLAGRAGDFDLAEEYGVNADRVKAFDSTTAMAVAVGIDALRDAGIPLVMHYKTTTTGTKLPERWRLPDPLRDDTGVIFASAFPGMDAFSEQLDEYYTERGHREQLDGLQQLRQWVTHQGNGNTGLLDELDRRIEELTHLVGKTEFHLDRRFLFRVLSMGHSQFAEEIGARGPNTQVNAACASTTQAVSIAEDWIRAGRCRRVIVVAADNVTSDHMLEWVGAGFLASGAAATDENVEDAATPFDRRRHGMIAGMGAAAFVVESAGSAAERGIQPICEVLAATSANSAFHGTRLDVEHISGIMEELICDAEQRHGIQRGQFAAETVFVSHETYTPARGGSASAEIHALRSVFGDQADNIVIANTKGFTGHAMGAGIEDVVAIKSIETGIVPPVPNFKEIDPELGSLNLSTGGRYPVRYALRLGAGFGSQVAMTLVRHIPAPDGRRRNPDQLGFDYRIHDRAAWSNWLSSVSGYPQAELEIIKHRLRIKDQGPPQFEVQSVAVTRSHAMQPVAQTPATQPDRPSIRPVPAAPAPAVTAPVATDPVQERVLEVVATATGYPPDMLDMELDLEADLGIDTVKQAEVFAAIRESYGIERDDNLRLREFPTLNHVVQFVRDRHPDPASLGAPATVGVIAPEPASTATAAGSTGGGAVARQIIALVADKTGYPADMLDIDLDMEADLGIDTVKQAEVFATIRESYDIPREDSLQLREFPTLAHVVKFVHDRRPDLVDVTARIAEPAVATPPAPVMAPAAAPDQGTDPVTQQIVALVAEKTGYPADMLDMDLDLEADLGIDTVKQAEVFASIRQAYDIPRDENLQLREFPTMAHVVGFVNDRRPQTGAVEPSSRPHGAAEASSSAPHAGGDDDAAIRDQVLAIVAEKTGYPSDMLDMELDLEADLGIDTVKQAEIFAGIRAAYDIPRDENLQLKDFPTLTHAVGFVKDRRPSGQTGVSADSATTKAVAATMQTGLPEGDMEAANQIPRRVPHAVWRPPLALCKPTGVELGESSRVIVMPDTGGVGKALIERLQKRQVETLVIESAPDADELERQIDAWLATGPIQGVYWLPGLDSDTPISQTDTAQWREALRLRVKLLYTTMQKLYEQIDSPGKFLVAATRLGGKHGYDDRGALNPMGGAIAGFVKAYRRERSAVLAKVVDFAPSRKTAALADCLIAETLADPGAVEIGICDDRRWTVGTRPVPVNGSPTGLELGSDTVFAITGAAGSIVSAITADLATHSSGTFHLLDLTPEPDVNDPDIARFATDKDGLKRDIFTRLQNGRQRATPVMVDKELARLERAHAAWTAIEAVKAAGGTAHYHSVDLTDPDAVAEVIGRIRQQDGKIDVLLHAAGIEISHFLPDKTQREYDLVFDVKSDGWYNLLHAIDDMPLGAAVVFSSVAGRFGNAGQTDYSAANDLLCKSVSSFRNTRPDTRGIAIDWTAWGGIGMASRGSIPTMMKAAGIDMLPPQAGIPVVRRELTQGPVAGEVVIGDRLGVLMQEYDETGGIDVERFDMTSCGPMIGRVARVGVHEGLVVKTRLDPGTQGFLFDHQIEGKPVLPGVMGLEAFAELAILGLPDWHIYAIEDIQFLAPFKFYRNEPRELTLMGQFESDGEQMIADCRLIGIRQLKSQAEPQVTTHFTARVRLTSDAPKTGRSVKPTKSNSNVLEPDDVYRVYFHGPAYRVLDGAWRDGNGALIGRMAADLPANHDGDMPLAMAPRHIELCFQTAGMYELGLDGRLALPARAERVIKFREPGASSEKPLFAVVTLAESGQYEAEVVDQSGVVYLRLEGYQTIELPDAPDEAHLAPIRAAVNIR